MRYFTATTVSAVLLAGAAHAAVLDVTYEFEAKLYEYDLLDRGSPETYMGPPLGTVEQVLFSYTVDTGDPEIWDAVRFDPETGEGMFFVGRTIDAAEYYQFESFGTGFYQNWTEYPLGNGDQRYYEILSWSVEVAPIPLPASLPLLGFGMAAIGLAAHRKRASRNA